MRPDTGKERGGGMQELYKLERTTATAKITKKFAENKESFNRNYRRKINYDCGNTTIFEDESYIKCQNVQR